MLPPRRLLETISYMLALKEMPDFPGGSVIECGTWKGGMALAAMRVFGEGRDYAFYDSFEGLPAPGPHDGEDAHWWAAHPEHPRFFDNCRAPLEDFVGLLEERCSGLRATIIPGWFEQSLWPERFEPIAWAHLDCDWYDSVTVCLERIWPHMAVGGVIMIDDYYDWEGCRRALHDFLSRHSAREAIERVGSQGGVAIRRLGRWHLGESTHMQ
jgi:hypothetical protein